MPRSLRDAVNREQPLTDGNKHPYHLYWQRIVSNDTPYLVGGARVIDGGPTGYMLKSLEPEAKDLNSLAWSLGIATALALVGSALLAQAAATTVLKPVHRLGRAARRLGEGKLDTRLRVSGTDELADLSRTFNRTAENLEKKVADMSAREEASRRFVADMSHELRTPLTAITAVTEVLEEELDAETGSVDPMIEFYRASRGERDAPTERPGGEPDGGDPLRQPAPPGSSSTTSTSPTRSRPASTPAPGSTRWTWTRSAASWPASTRAASTSSWRT